MSSLLTNRAGMVALQTLSATSRNLETTQNRISTGLRVANASDNAAYWSIATTMKSDNGALSAVKDALALGSATIDVATSALNAAKDVTNEIKNKLVAAKQPGVDRQKVQDEISALQSQLSSIAESAVFSGQNWLAQDSSVTGYTATRSVVASFNRDAMGAVSVGTIDIDTSKIKLYDSNGGAGTPSGIVDLERTGSNGNATSIANLNIASLTDSVADQEELSDFIEIADGALNDIISAASSLGASKTRIDMQSAFVSSLSDSIAKGVGALVDADMNVESTRLQALQVQQQLGVQALSIANQNTSMILRLFN